MYYSRDQILEARDMSLLDYLQHNGYELIKSSNNEYRLKEHDSLVISNNKWNWFSRGMGGNTIDFLTKYEGKSFKEAVGVLLGENSIKGKTEGVSIKPYVKKNKKEPSEIKLPEKNENYRRLFAYLIKTRCIDKNIVTDLVKEKLIYETKGTHNVVFLGKDRDGNVKHAAMRGTLTNKSFKGDCEGSDKSYCFNLKGKNDTLYVFESAIDLLSHATLAKMRKKNYKTDHRISAGCVSGLSVVQYLKDNPGIRNITLCLDNDKAGIEATERIKNELMELGRYNIYDNFPPSGKDWNEYLKKIFYRVKRRDEKAII